MCTETSNNQLKFLSHSKETFNLTIKQYYLYIYIYLQIRDTADRYVIETVFYLKLYLRLTLYTET